MEVKKEEVDVLVLGNVDVDIFKNNPSSNDDDSTNAMKIIIKCKGSKEFSFEGSAATTVKNVFIISFLIDIRS